MISKRVLRLLRRAGPLTAPEISQRLGIPCPHIRAAISEMCYRDRLIRSPDGQRLEVGRPPESWPKWPKS